MFDYAAKAEAIHARLYQLALEAVQKGKDLPQDKIYLCPICGDIEFGLRPKRALSAGEGIELYPGPVVAGVAPKSSATDFLPPTG